MRVSQSFTSQLVTLAFVFAGVLVLSPAANATLITVPVNQIQRPGDNPFDPVTLGGPDITILDDGHHLVLQENSANFVGQPNSDAVVDLAPGAVISGRTQSLTGTDQELPSNFPINQVDYLGFEIYGNPGQFEFGYLTFEITRDSCGLFDIDFYSFTYDNSGAPVTVAALQANDSSSLGSLATPEPASAGTLALGGAALLAGWVLLRRLRASARFVS